MFIIRSQIKKIVKVILQYLFAFLNNHSSLKVSLQSLINRLGLGGFIRKLCRKVLESAVGHRQRPVPNKLSDINPHAREIYFQLKKAIQENKGKL